MKNILKIKVAIVLPLIMAGSIVFAQNGPTVPFDPTVKTGTLENGIKYYIKHNKEPKERVSFYFAQSVGSILEKETQRGIAHFLEHMSFNGTKHYEDKKMLEYLEKNGVKFGSEINAFTSFDKTVYNISNVPTTNEKMLDSVLLILHDWSGSLSLTDEEIDNERGVVNEEWRTRNTPGYRASEKIWTQGLLKGSLYEKRMPIGSMSVINNFEYEELRDYYRKWYRPDQQAVIVVGDVDVSLMEKKVNTVFSQIPIHNGLPAREYVDVPLTKDFVFIQALDKELGDAVLEYYIKNRSTRLTGKAHIDHTLIGSMVSYILNNRFKEFVLGEPSPLLSVNYAYSNFVRPLDVMSLNIQPRKGQIKEAFEFALTELSRFAKFGATNGELERAKAAFRNNYISYLKNRDKISNETYANELYSHFFDHTPFPDIAWEVNYLTDKIGNIFNEEIIQYMDPKFKYEDIVLAVKGTDEDSYLDGEAFKKIMEVVKEKKLEEYKEEVNDGPMIPEKLTISKVKGTFGVDNTDAQGHELSNGAKIVLYPTLHDKDKVYLYAFSKGGTSLLDKSLLPSAQIATYVASESGMGSFSKMSLQKKLAGTDTSLELEINELNEVLRGNSTRKDIEVLLQKIYLSFEAPRFEEKAFNLTMDRVEKNIRDREKNKKNILQDSMTLARTDYSGRTVLLNKELPKNISLEGVKKVYRDRFKNAGDFTFVFVGDIDGEELLSMAQKYIGNISSEKKEEDHIDHELEPADGKTVVAFVEEMETPQTTINISFTEKLKYTPKNQLTIYMIGQLLSKRYMDMIREQAGGSYGIWVSGNMHIKPKERYNLEVKFDCDPEKAEKLVQIVYDEVKKLGSQIDMADFREVKEFLIKQRTQAVENNPYWLYVISDHLSNGIEIMSLGNYTKLVGSISPDDIKKIAKTIFTDSDIVEGIMGPQQPYTQAVNLN